MDVSYLVSSTPSNCQLNTLVCRILRPGFFMENFDGTVGKITTAVIRCGLQPTTLVQLIVGHSPHHHLVYIFAYRPI